MFLLELLLWFRGRGFRIWGFMARCLGGDTPKLLQYAFILLSQLFGLLQAMSFQHGFVEAVGYRLEILHKIMF